MWPNPSLIKAWSSAWNSQELVDSEASNAVISQPIIDAFEVIHPIQLPESGFKCETNLLRNHQFAFSYGAPFVGNYSPNCQSTGPWSKVILTFSSNVMGRQFDRMGAVWVFWD
jgi:Peptide N-acetyl-beta-D-glucosaminyl asparaginase amidase A